jgi:hypothetical protein
MVTLRQRLRQLVAGASAQPAPKAAVSGGEKQDLFRARARDSATLARNAAIYESGGIVTQAIKAPGRAIISNGWRLEGEDRAVQQVQESLDNMDFETLVSMLVDYAYVQGNGIAEIVPLRGGGTTAQLRDPAVVRVRQDSLGNISGYLFTVGDMSDRGVLLAPEEVIDLVLDPVPNSPYGRALVSTAIDEILRDAKTNEGLAKAIERHGWPKLHIQVGQPGEVIAKDDLLSIEKEFRNLSAKNDFVTPRDVDIGAIDTAGITGAADLDNIFLMRLCTALGVPPEVIGLDAKGSTEATATVRFKAWYDRVRSLQHVVATTLSRQLCDRITGRPGACWLVFNDPSPEDVAKKAEWITKVMMATPLDPFAVLPQEWVQEQFGIEPGAN